MHWSCSLRGIVLTGQEQQQREQVRGGRRHGCAGGGTLAAPPPAAVYIAARGTRPHHTQPSLLLQVLQTYHSNLHYKL